jgi:hypothetical protein
MPAAPVAAAPAQPKAAAPAPVAAAPAPAAPVQVTGAPVAQRAVAAPAAAPAQPKAAAPAPVAAAPQPKAAPAAAPVTSAAPAAAPAPAAAAPQPAVASLPRAGVPLSFATDTSLPAGWTAAGLALIVVLTGGAGSVLRRRAAVTPSASPLAMRIPSLSMSDCAPIVRPPQRGGTA